MYQGQQRIFLLVVPDQGMYVVLFRLTKWTSEMIFIPGGHRRTRFSSPFIRKMQRLMSLQIKYYVQHGHNPFVYIYLTPHEGTLYRLAQGIFQNSIVLFLRKKPLS